MAPLRSILTRDRAELVGDALLATGAAFSAVIGLSALILAPTGEPREGLEWLTAVASLLAMATVVVVPVLVWLQHGRRLSWLAVLGGVVGAISAGAVFMALAALSGLLGLIVSPFTDFEYAGPLAMLVVVSVAYAGAVLWLLVDGIRDLRSSQPRHRRMDGVRIVSALVLVALVTGTAWSVAQNPGDESGEAPIFMMLAGLSGALAVTGAELLTSLAARGGVSPGRTDLPTGGGGPPGAPV
jgi:hypothetical protein